MAAALDLMSWQVVTQAPQPMLVPCVATFDGQCWFNGPPSPCQQGDYFAMFPTHCQGQEDVAALVRGPGWQEEESAVCPPDWEEPGLCQTDTVEEDTISKEASRKPRRRGKRRNKTGRKAAAAEGAQELPPGQVASSEELGSPLGAGTEEASPQPAKVGLQESHGAEDACELLLDIGKDTLISRLEAEDTREATLELLLKDLLRVALNKDGCRVVQKALDVVDSAQRSKLLAAIQPHVVSLYQSMHGNYVITKAIEQVPAANLGGIVSELEKHGFEEVAKHRFGCRVLERLIEHCEENDLSRLIAVVKEQACALSRHQFANFVVQHLFEHSPSQRSALLHSFLDQVPQLAMHRVASHVVQKALSYSKQEDQQALIQTMLRAEGETALEQVALGRYGSYVVEQLADLPISAGAVRQRLEAAWDEPGSSQFGIRVPKRFGLLTDR